MWSIRQGDQPRHGRSPANGIRMDAPGGDLGGVESTPQLLPAGIESEEGDMIPQDSNLEESIPQGGLRRESSHREPKPGELSPRESSWERPKPGKSSTRRGGSRI